MNLQNETQGSESSKETPEFVKLDALSTKQSVPAPDTPTPEKHAPALEEDCALKAGDKEGSDNKDAELLLSK